MSWHQEAFQQSNVVMGQRWVCVTGDLTKDHFHCAICVVYAANESR